MPLLLRAGNASAWTGPDGNNTWLLRGRVPALVDAGTGAESHLTELQNVLQGQPLQLLLITHGHVDHVSGTGAIRALWPAVRVQQFMGGLGLQHGEHIEAGDTRLKVLHTPGHSPDHCCFFDEHTGDLYCGDLVRLGGTVVIPATRGGDLTQYLASLQLVRSLAPKRLLPGHGPIVEDPDPLIAAYLRHRAERDEQIVRALARGAKTASEIVRTVYAGLDPSLERAAAETVLAHLLKLSDEGRVRQDTQAAGDLASAEWVQAG